VPSHELSWAQPNPNDKSIGSAVFAQLTAESPNGRPFSPKLPLRFGGFGPPSNS